MPSDLEARTASFAFERATICAREASRAISDERRALFLRLRDSWIEIANEVQLVPRLPSPRGGVAIRRLRAAQRRR